MTSIRVRLVRTVGAIGVATALVSGGVYATAIASVPAASDVAFDRSLNLEGAQNARDVGGYVTEDGRMVRTGLVFRTDALNLLTAADLASLQSRNVKVVDDLRTIYERTIQPDRVPAGATANWYDVLGGSPVTTLVDLPSAYSAFIDGPGASEAFAAVLRDIRDTDGAVIYHCSAGKDRTGWTTAVLLTLLGVDRATVTEDFLLSNVYRGTDGTGSAGSLNGVREEWLDIAFSTAEQRYGSFDNYVREGLGLSDADVAALRAKLLTDA